MKISRLLFGSFVAMWLVLGASLLVPQNEHPRGLPHRNPKHKAMEQGGDGQQKHRQLLWFGWGFGALQIVVFVAALPLGARPNRRRALGIPLCIGGVLFLATFTAMVLSYRSYLDSSSTAFLGPFPTPTTLMILGTWATPFFFVILYVIEYPRSIWSADDEESFQQLLSSSRQRAEEQN